MLVLWRARQTHTKLAKANSYMSRGLCGLLQVFIPPFPANNQSRIPIPKQHVIPDVPFMKMSPPFRYRELGGLGLRA